MRKWRPERDGREEKDGSGGVLGLVVDQRPLALGKVAADVTIFGCQLEMWNGVGEFRVQSSAMSSPTGDA